MLSRSEYYLEILEYPKEELFEIAEKTAAFILHTIKDQYGDGDLPYDLTIDLVFTYAFYDGYVTEEKRELIKNIFTMDMSDEDLLGLANFHKNEGREERDKILNKLRKNEEFADAEFLLAISIYALDGEITKEEQNFIESNIRQDIIKYKKGNA
ncbi:MAG: hypothetical protein MJ222_04140 [Bacilli bacterium]|nr:hypothetical protein [Bacilli bacterium]